MTGITSAMQNHLCSLLYLEPLRKARSRMSTSCTYHMYVCTYMCRTAFKLWTVGCGLCLIHIFRRNSPTVDMVILFYVLSMRCGRHRNDGADQKFCVIMTKVTRRGRKYFISLTRGSRILIYVLVSEGAIRFRKTLYTQLNYIHLISEIFTFETIITYRFLTVTIYRSNRNTQVYIVPKY